MPASVFHPSKAARKLSASGGFNPNSLINDSAPEPHWGQLSKTPDPACGFDSFKQFLKTILFGLY